MRRPVAIVGLGQLGAILGQGLLRLGRPVLPLVRGDDPAALLPHDPELVVVSVAEKDLDAVLASMPERLRARLTLVQNELVPGDWERFGVLDPTVAVVWFEKKRGRAPKIVRTTRVSGPYADLIVGALESCDLPARRIDTRDLAFELVRKNLYILGSNITGLLVGGNTGDLSTTHRALATEILVDVIAIESARVGRQLPIETLLECTFSDFAKDPAHASTGRSAPDRLARALQRADALGVDVPALHRVAARPQKP